ncbi:hypothetical protein PQQ65_34200 [Paraburkholderia strydomiana]|uniref:hypothetical protein n=1 Tax=Paraburkholderia strydomiana TaxID=1245417 RepID=UPI0038B85551
MSIIRQSFVGTFVMICAVGTVLAAPPASYTTTVRLHSGKQVMCAVNEPAAAPAAGAQTLTLTASERNEAEVAATAILRRQAGNRNAYPSPTTAPHVQCW